MEQFRASTQGFHFDGIVHRNNDICLFVGMTDLKSLANHSFALDGLAIVLIRRGHASAMVDNVSYSLEEGMVWVLNPHVFVKETLVSLDIEITGMFVSTELTCKMLQDLHVNYIPLAIDGVRASAPLPEEDRSLFEEYIETYAKLLKRADSNCKAKAVNALAQSFGWFMFELMQQGPDAEGSLPVVQSSAESKITQFLKLISEQHGSFLNVEGYAKQLCISPKYFSNICKRVTGRTVGSLINEHVVREAKLQLSVPDVPVKDIAYRLGFANPSHFGTFLKRHTGMSPQELRASLLGVTKV